MGPPGPTLLPTTKATGCQFACLRPALPWKVVASLGSYAVLVPLPQGISANPGARQSVKLPITQRPLFTE